MQKPTIHLNGTSKEALFEQNVEAAGAIRKAILVLNEAAPNARDYYVQSNEAFSRAALEHTDRIARLKSVLVELEEILEHIADH